MTLMFILMQEISTSKVVLSAQASLSKEVKLYEIELIGAAWLYIIKALLTSYKLFCSLL